MVMPSLTQNGYAFFNYCRVRIAAAPRREPRPRNMPFPLDLFPLAGFAGLMAAAVVDGLLSLVLVSSAALRTAFARAGVPAIPVSRMPVPYGVAIAAAALIVTIPPSLSQ